MSSWKTDAEAGIASGSTHLFSFNEPDVGAQANLSPQAAATAYKTYMSDMFGGRSGVKLCAPSVTNGPGPMGLTWLSSFMSACTDCQIDCINLHWYGTESSDFISHVKSVVSQYSGKDIFVSEFALNNSPAPSTDTVTKFLSDTLTYLDGANEVTGYSYFMAATGSNMLCNGNQPSVPIGQTYRDFTG